jgi:hypothetical protein
MRHAGHAVLWQKQEVVCNGRAKALEVNGLGQERFHHTL